MSLWPKLPKPLEFEQSDKLAHFIAYMVLMLWFANIYPQRPHHLRLSTAFLAMGICLELLQTFSKYRTFSYGDIIANGFGVFLGFFLAKTHLATFLTNLDTRLAQIFVE
ncbi:MAG: VanZ family protein [Syntrophobacteria bacterium]